MEEELQSNLISLGAILVPFAVVSEIYALFTASGQRGSVMAFGSLIVVRLFYWLIEMLGTSVAWRLINRRRMIDWILTALRTNRFPPIEPPGRSYSSYMKGILNANTPAIDYVRAAHQLESSAQIIKSNGVLAESRFNDAANSALAIYATINPEPDRSTLSTAQKKVSHRAV